MVPCEKENNSTTTDKGDVWLPTKVIYYLDQYTFENEKMSH